MRVCEARSGVVKWAGMGYRRGREGVVEHWWHVIGALCGNSIEPVCSGTTTDVLYVHINCTTTSAR